jgi:hypothetical protein
MIIMDKLSAKRREMINHILLLLAQYLFLDRDTLDFFAGRKIKLQYIRLAKKLGLIVETQNMGKLCKKEEYFFKLGENGIHILLKDSIPHKKFKTVVFRSAKEKVLTFNRYLMQKKKRITYELLDSRFNAFIDGFDIYYFSKFISEEDIFNILKPTLEKVVRKRLKEDKDNVPGTPVEITQKQMKEYFNEAYRRIEIDYKMVEIMDETKSTLTK